MQSNRKSRIDSDKYIFSLKSLVPGAYYRQPLTIAFCPKLDRDGKAVAHSFPTFNNDKKQHTPAFILDLDKNYTLQMNQQMQMDQQKKIKEAELSKKELLIPKPSHKNKYCSVCKSNYDEYIQVTVQLFSILKVPITKNQSQNLCSTLFKTQETIIKSDRDESTKQKQDQEIPPITKKRRLDTKKQTQSMSTSPCLITITPQMLNWLKQFVFLPQLPPINIPQQYNAVYNYVQYPFSFPQVPVGYPTFIHPETLLPQFPVLINSPTRIQ